MLPNVCTVQPFHLHLYTTTEIPEMDCLLGTSYPPSDFCVLSTNRSFDSIMAPQKRARSASPAGSSSGKSATSTALKAAAAKKSPAAAVIAAAAAVASPKTKPVAAATPTKKAVTPSKKTAAAASPSPKKSDAHVAKGSVDPDLPMTPDGVVYHLACTKKDLADKVLLVGDPGRVPVVAERFDKGSIIFDGSHREIRVITGKYKGTPVTCLSTGMGTDNVEIVINEIHALKEYDVKTHHWQTDKERKPGNIHLIRIGTCGCPRPDVAVGTLAISNHAIGMDNTCRYYDPPAVNSTDSVKALQAAVNKTSLGKIGVYATKANPEVVAALSKAVDAFNKKTKSKKEQVESIVGTTASGSGFYGCQGRAVGKFRGHLTVPNLVDELGALEFPTGKNTKETVVNIEMENSAVCYLSNLLGYKAGTMCAIIARRAGDMREFATPEVAKHTLAAAITIGLEALTSL